MTSLSGEFHTDLALPEALTACADAIHGLGWPIESVDGRKIVSHAGPPDEYPPTIEVVLAESADGTEIRINGSDSESNPLEQEALVADLTRARDAIEVSIESSSEDPDTRQFEEASHPEARRAVPGWYPDAYDSNRLQYWDGERWSGKYRPAEVVSQAEASAGGGDTSSRFRSLHVIAGIYGSLGWLVVIFGTVGVIAAAVNAHSNGSNTAPGTILLVGLIGVAFYALLLFGISAAIRLALAVEENTRATVEALTRGNSSRM